MVVAISFVGALLGLLIIAFIVGCCLPERYEAEVTAFIPSSPQAVWDAICNYERNPLSGRHTKEVLQQESDNGLPSWREKVGKALLSVQTHRSDPPWTLSRTIEEPSSRQQAEIEYRLNEANRGCRIAIQKRLQIPRGTWTAPILRLLHSLEGTSRDVKRHLAELGQFLNEPVRYESSHWR